MIKSNKPPTPLKPGDKLGIIGGGQLGRMLAIEAANLGLKTSIFDPEPNAPAFDVAHNFVQASYDNQTALEDFAKANDRLTFEFENIPAASAKRAERFTPLYPNSLALEKTQDRLIEKQFLQDLSLPLAPFYELYEPLNIEQALEKAPNGIIVKTRRFGYDGKGQIRVLSKNDINKTEKMVKETPCLAENIIKFDYEISIIMACQADTQNERIYPCALNTHKEGILAQSEAPAQIPPEITQEASQITKKIAKALNYTGVLAVEFFVLKDKSLLINEIAPRVHNSGHWTLDGCHHNQFENHIRAIAGWPLASTSEHSHIMMHNLIGEDVKKWPLYAAQQEASLYLYGKKHIRDGRKMGHVNLIRKE